MRLVLRRIGRLLLGTLLVSVVAAVAAAGFGAYAYVFGLPGAESAAPATLPVRAEHPAPAGPAPPPPRPVNPTTTTTAVPEPEGPEVSVVELPELPPGGLGEGARGPDVAVYQMRIGTIGLDPGPATGWFGPETRYAIEAIQKLFGLDRTGVIDERTRFFLSVWAEPEPVVPEADEPTRVEVDLDRQVMLVWRDGALAVLTTVSTGSGRRFCGGYHGCQVAVTPAGRFEFTWRWDGWRTGDLGRMYNPVYFHTGGLAVHGYDSVPTEPASSGCVRIPNHVAEYFPGLVAEGDVIYVVGEEAAP